LNNIKTLKTFPPLLVATGHMWSVGLVMTVVWRPRRYIVLCSRRWTPSVKQRTLLCVYVCHGQRCM